MRLRPVLQVSGAGRQYRNVVRAVVLKVAPDMRSSAVRQVVQEDGTEGNAAAGAHNRTARV